MHRCNALLFVAPVPEKVYRVGLNVVTSRSEQSVHQPLVGFSLLFQVVMLFHVEFSVPHHSLSQLVIWQQPLRLMHKFLRRRVQQASELMLHYCCISWNVPGQHGHTEVHGLQNGCWHALWDGAVNQGKAPFHGSMKLLLAPLLGQEDPCCSFDNSFHFNSKYRINLRETDTSQRQAKPACFHQGCQQWLNLKDEINNDTINNFYHEQIILWKSCIFRDWGQGGVGGQSD